MTLREWRQSSEVLNKAKQDVEPEVIATRKAFVAQHVDALAAEKLNMSEKRLRALWKRAAEQRN